MCATYHGPPKLPVVLHCGGTLDEKFLRVHQQVATGSFLHVCECVVYSHKEPHKNNDLYVQRTFGLLSNIFIYVYICVSGLGKESIFYREIIYFFFSYSITNCKKYKCIEGKRSC